MDPFKGEIPELSKPWKTLVEEPILEPEFLLNPYIPKGGIVLCYGVSSIGKSPLMWNIAYCVSKGEPFFGLPTQKGPVLFLELDSTEVSTRRRLKSFPGEPPEDVYFEFFHGLNVPHVSAKDTDRLFKARDSINPSLVIINTLRKAHDLDDKDSLTAKSVYEWFVRAFGGGRALLFVHHERKQPVSFKDREGMVDRERFSGSNAWLNDAQVGLHLRATRTHNSNLALWHVKSQETELFKPMPLKLEKDGTTLRCPLLEEHQVIRGILEASEGRGAREIDSLIGQTLNITERSARTKRIYAQEHPTLEPLSLLGRWEPENDEENES